MKRLKIYIETSVWNFLITKDSPEKRSLTEHFFREVDQRKHEIFVSDVVMDELSEAAEQRRNALRELIHRYEPGRLLANADFEYLAAGYLKAGIVPERFENDLLHIAIAVAHNMDLVLSWNMKHIVKYRTKVEVNSINLREGFRAIELLTPEEVVDDE
jgi:predicted nucleic acid-binding protein